MRLRLMDCSRIKFINSQRFSINSFGKRLYMYNGKSLDMYFRMYYCNCHHMYHNMKRDKFYYLHMSRHKSDYIWSQRFLHNQMNLHKFLLLPLDGSFHHARSEPRLLSLTLIFS